MKMRHPDNNGFNTLRSPSTRASIHRSVWVVLSFVFGMALIWGLNFRPQKNTEPETQGQGSDSVVLSDSTKAILQGLKATVEIRLYSPANPAELPDTFSGFAARVQRMIFEYDRVADGKIKLIQADPRTAAAARSAAGGLGIVPFLGSSGKISHLGIVITCGKRTEVMPQLAPEWEAALESDLSRAILRVSTVSVSPNFPVTQTMATPSAIDPAVSEELLKLFPDLSSQTFADAAKSLREMALEEWNSVAIEMQSKVQIARKNLVESLEQKSESDQQSALKEFQRVQSEQADKLKQITARLQERITVLERLKNAPHQAAPGK